MSKTIRCAVCDITNNPHVGSLSSTTAAHTSRYFAIDVSNPHQYICLECREEVNEALSDFRDEEDD